MRNKLLWMGQGLLALAFLVNGGAKILLSKSDLAAFGPAYAWVVDASPQVVVVVGVIELAGAIGVILPWAIGVQRRLTAWAAAGLTVTMLVAMVLHAARAEFSFVPVNLVLAAVGVSVFLGRRAGTTASMPDGKSGSAEA